MKTLPHAGQSIESFLSDLARPVPTLPAGGCADALMGATAAALLKFVAQASLKRHKNPEMLEKLAAMGSHLAFIQNRCVDIMEQDAEAYDRIIRALRLPEETEFEKTESASILQDAFTKALDPLLQLIRLGLEMLDYGRFLVCEGYPAALADAAAASEMAHSCIRGAVWMAKANLHHISDSRFVLRQSKMLKADQERAGKLHLIIVEAFEKSLQ